LIIPASHAWNASSFLNIILTIESRINANSIFKELDIYLILLKTFFGDVRKKRRTKTKAYTQINSIGVSPIKNKYTMSVAERKPNKYAIIQLDFAFFLTI
jgi:hypothetical protein